MKKFDFCVGNPPYQMETAKKATKNGMKRSKSVFQYLQIEADKISNASVLVYPAIRWIHQAGKGMATFGQEQMNDVHLSKIVFYPNAKDVFPSIGITDGISIVSKKQNKKAPGFIYEYKTKEENLTIKAENPGNNIMPLYPKDFPIVKKIQTFVDSNNFNFLHDSVLSQKLFGIESSFIEDNQDKVKPYTKDLTIDYSKEVKLLANDKAGSAGRSKWYVVNKNLIQKGKEFIGKWKVVVISANPGSQRRDNQLQIIDNHSAFGRSKVALKTFDDKKEAINFFKYSNSLFIRYTMLLTNEALTSFAKYTPDILNYSSDNSVIDFDKSVSVQFYKLLNLTEEEIKYIEKKMIARGVKKDYEEK